ncbi:hypothetical protein LCGC14_3056910 [marine sediment metagenome]|uniref:Uncharacterized protein n=1 Tax=marine sediment metagenome TaxID=412755 RepID=A0A0F8WKI6_9ZZZZ
MSIHATTPLILLGPGGDYRTEWSESDIVAASGIRFTAIALTVAFAVLIAAAILFDPQTSRPATGGHAKGAESLTLPGFFPLREAPGAFRRVPVSCCGTAT